VLEPILRRTRCLSIFAFISLATLACAPSDGHSGNPESPQSPASSATSREPGVTKVDPPNWWAGLTPEVMLLMTGQNLQDSKVACEYPGVRVLRSKVTAGGKYLFVWLQIAPKVQAGAARLHIESSAGSTDVDFPIAQREPTQGKFQGFSPEDVIYLIMLDRFADGDPGNNNPAASPGLYDRSNPRAYHGGDLRGILQHLDYLRDLGVTTIWLTPIVDNDNSSAQDYHGYGAVDEYAVEEHFGALKDLQELVAAAHEKRMKLILDFVPNHVGPRHPWAASAPEPDWFHGTKEHHLIASGDFQYLTDPHAPPGYWRNVVEGWFADVLPDLNQENADVADYFIDNALWWSEETGIDGYRLDTFPYVSRQFWSKWHQALTQVYPQMTTVGEVFNPDPSITSFFAGGRRRDDGMDSGVTTVFDYPLYTALRQMVLNDGPPAGIVGILAQDQLYPHPEILVPFLGNHDVARLASAKGISGEKLKLAFSILLTMRGTPELYYGDEIGMTGGNDPDNRHDFPGGFPGDKQNAFLESGRTPEQQELFSHVQMLLRLRHEHLALRRGQLWHIFWDQNSYAFARVSGKESVLVAFNTGGEKKSLRLSLADTPLEAAQKLKSLFGGQDSAVQDGSVEITLAAHETQIYSVN
jgi:neopullulanase